MSEGEGEGEGAKLTLNMPLSQHRQHTLVAFYACLSESQGTFPLTALNGLC